MRRNDPRQPWFRVQGGGWMHRLVVALVWVTVVTGASDATEEQDTNDASLTRVDLRSGRVTFAAFYVAPVECDANGGSSRTAELVRSATEDCLRQSVGRHCGDATFPTVDYIGLGNAQCQTSNDTASSDAVWIRGGVMDFTGTTSASDAVPWPTSAQVWTCVVTTVASCRDVWATYFDTVPAHLVAYSPLEAVTRPNASRVDLTTPRTSNNDTASHPSTHRSSSTMWSPSSPFFWPTVWGATAMGGILATLWVRVVHQRKTHKQLGVSNTMHTFDMHDNESDPETQNSATSHYPEVADLEGGDPRYNDLCVVDPPSVGSSLDTDGSSLDSDGSSTDRVKEDAGLTSLFHSIHATDIHAVATETLPTVDPEDDGYISSSSSSCGLASRHEIPQFHANKCNGTTLTPPHVTMEPMAPVSMTTVPNVRHGVHEADHDPYHSGASDFEPDPDPYHSGASDFEPDMSWDPDDNSVSSLDAASLALSESGELSFQHRISKGMSRMPLSLHDNLSRSQAHGMILHACHDSDSDDAPQPPDDPTVRSTWWRTPMAGTEPSLRRSRVSRVPSTGSDHVPSRSLPSVSLASTRFEVLHDDAREGLSPKDAHPGSQHPAPYMKRKRCNNTPSKVYLLHNA